MDVNRCVVKRFIVVELHKRKPHTKTPKEDYVYLVYKKYGVETGRLLDTLSGFGASVFGIKDRYADAFFYMTTRKPIGSGVNIPGVKIWYLGKGDRARKGAHQGNYFRITASCDSWKGVERRRGDLLFFPNLYGPQRFGVFEPNTHVLGDFMVSSWLPGLFMEYRRGARRGGWFEKRLFREIENSKFTGASLPAMLERLFMDSFYSYIFNRLASKTTTMSICEDVQQCIIRDDLIVWREVGYYGKRVSLPYISPKTLDTLLKYNGILTSRHRRRIIRLLRMRPVIAPLARYRVTHGENSVTASFILPPGSYATVALFFEGIFLVPERRK